MRSLLNIKIYVFDSEEEKKHLKFEVEFMAKDVTVHQQGYSILSSETR